MNRLLLYPRALLLIDAVGAAMTSFATVYLLAGRRIEVGMPVGLLYAIATVAACFACFDVAALSRRTDPAIPLRIIACANIGYCFLVILSLYAYRSSVTYLGVAYFCFEIPIVVLLAVWEWIVASRAFP